MRKMSADDTTAVVRILRAWRQRRLTWERLRTQVSVEILDGAETWSRQSLQAHESIRIAWAAAKRRLTNKDRSTPTGSEDASLAALEKLQGEYQELQTKYDRLALRHRQLAYNASMLPGGTRLLIDPLPDNTPDQTIYRSSKRGH